MHRQFGRIPSPYDGRDYRLGTYIQAPLLRVSRVVFGGRQVWGIPRVLDQKDTNHCVGFACAQFGNVLPTDSNQTNEDGHILYYMAKVIDDAAMGEDGTTLRSGARALKHFGMVSAYAFAHSIDEIATWLRDKGSVIVGTNWYASMMEPDARGFVRPEGGPCGGHAWLLVGYDLSNPFNRYFIGLNSWGAEWGKGGAFYIRTGDMARLLAAGGEAMTAVENQPAVETQPAAEIQQGERAGWVI